MTTSKTSSAKIYQFPAGGRSSHVAGRRAPAVESRESTAPAPLIMPESGWYHEAAARSPEPQQQK